MFYLHAGVDVNSAVASLQLMQVDDDILIPLPHYDNLGTRLSSGRKQYLKTQKYVLSLKRFVIKLLKFSKLYPVPQTWLKAK